ncbi:MAG TPA: hypothetical protein VFO83_06410, partial [Aggregicoccus sp.]|nr:hypothetical protein [Aggregicoccus sp.]
MRTRLLTWLCAALALGAGGVAAYWWQQPPAPTPAPPQPTAAAPARAAPPAPPQPTAAPPQPASGGQADGQGDGQEAQRRREQLEALAQAPGGLAQLTQLYARSAEGAEREQVLGAVARVGDAAAV